MWWCLCGARCRPGFGFHSQVLTLFWSWGCERKAFRERRCFLLCQQICLLKRTHFQTHMPFLRSEGEVASFKLNLSVPEYGKFITRLFSHPMVFCILLKTLPNLCIYWYLMYVPSADELWATEKCTRNKKFPFLLLNILNSHIAKKDLKVAHGLPSLNLNSALFMWYSCHQSFNPSLMDISQCTSLQP